MTPAVQLTVDGAASVLNLTVDRPSLSWTVQPGGGPWRQAGYEVQLRTTDGQTSTHRADSSTSLAVPWPFDDLTAPARVDVRVRLTGTDGRTTQWSNPVRLETGPSRPANWQARMITAPRELGNEPGTPLYLRRAFPLPPGSGVRSARLHATAFGIYRAELNGTRVGDVRLAPGWSAYAGHVRYQTYDVADLLRSDNVLAVTVADGWWRGYLGWEGDRALYGEQIGFLGELEIEYDDGTRTVVGTDGRWTVGHGPVTFADLYQGERYDAQLADESPQDNWLAAVPMSIDRSTLRPQTSPPVRVTEHLPAVAVQPSANGYIADFGQNLVGVVRLQNIAAEAGTEIVLRHAEVVLDGELCTDLLRGARQVDIYVADGSHGQSWSPEFTMHGFRYAEVIGWPRPLEPADLTALVCHSDMRRTGWFDCSHPLLTQLHENAVWGMRGNFVDVPTDCPQRDERVGWTGDLQVFSPTASYLFDCQSLIRSWLGDLVIEQYADGGVPEVVPNPFGRHYFPGAGIAAAWSDAAIVVPWVLYERFGDEATLRAQYDSMTRYLTRVVDAHTPDLDESLWQYGDWLDPTVPTGDSRGRTDEQLIACAYLIHDADILAQAAGILGHDDDAVRWQAVAQSYRELWRGRFVLSDGRLSSDYPTAYCLAICFGLVEDPAPAGQRLQELVRDDGYRIGTGFVGTPLVMDALTATGHLDTAYRLLMQTDCPSFLYPVTQGATTIWERWDSLLPDGRPNSADMTSFNHYALGAVCDWLHRTVGGLAPGGPGYATVTVAPRPGGGITWARTEHETPYGSAVVSWRLDGDDFVCDVTVPPNTTATVALPITDAAPAVVGSGTAHFRGRYAGSSAPGPYLPTSGAGWRNGPRIRTP